MRCSRSAVLCGVALTVACGDITDPADICAQPLACQVSGVDRVVEPPRLLLDEDHPHDPETGMPIFMPDEAVTYEVSVFNRGDTRSAATSLRVHGGEIPLPSLDPGTVFRDTLEWVPPSRFMWLERDTETMVAYFPTPPPGEDPLHANDFAVSAPFIVAVPVLHVTVDAPDTVVATEPFTARVTVSNVSRFVDLEPMAMAFCIGDYNVCGTDTVIDLPALAADGSWTADVVLTIRQHHFYGDRRWSLRPCFASAGSPIDEFGWTDSDTCLSAFTPIHVRIPNQQEGGP